MRVVLFLQVVLLFALVAYVVLLQLENPVLVTLPLPVGRATLPLGAVLGGAVVVGGLYFTLLLAPGAIRGTLRRRRAEVRRKEAEARLSAALQAKLAAPGTPDLTPQEPTLDSTQELA